MVVQADERTIEQDAPALLLQPVAQLDVLDDRLAEALRVERVGAQRRRRQAEVARPEERPRKLSGKCS